MLGAAREKACLPVFSLVSGMKSSWETGWEMGWETDDLMFLGISEEFTTRLTKSDGC